jgi:hypothetical protein
MAGAGWVLRLTGDAGVHYPGSFLVLIPAYARVESALFAIVGSFLIPLSLARIQAPMIGAPATGPDPARRARRAYTATFAGYVLNTAVLLGWEFFLAQGPRRWLAAFPGGLKGELVAWGLGFLVAFAIAAVFLYVPIRAVEEGSSFGDALWGGIREGFRLLGPSLFIVLAFAWPTLLVLAPLQLRPTLLVTRFRPELIVWLIAVASVLNSFVNYYIYAAASRLHWITRGRES